VRDQLPSRVPLSSGWPDCIRSAVIYVISVAHYAITYARGWAANSINARVRLAAENDRLNQENQLLREETVLVVIPALSSATATVPSAPRSPGTTASVRRPWPSGRPRIGSASRSSRESQDGRVVLLT